MSTPGSTCVGAQVGAGEMSGVDCLHRLRSKAITGDRVAVSVVRGADMLDLTVVLSRAAR